LKKRTKKLLLVRVANYPLAVEPDIDDAKEPTTLIVFELEEALAPRPAATS
jgi:hypothetical protein